jgi:hypothetical protein
MDLQDGVKGQTYAQNAYVTLLSVESTIKDPALAEGPEARSAAAASLRKGCASLQSLASSAARSLSANRTALRALRLCLRFSLITTIAILVLSVGVRVALYRWRDPGAARRARSHRRPREKHGFLARS